MSIALESSSNTIEGSGFIRGMSSCVSIFEAPDSGRQIANGMEPQDRRFPADDRTARRAEDQQQEAASCSSSIGRNSDCSGGQLSSLGSDGEDSEVQSSYKGPLDTMDALEESLPIRRGISKFYCGKSKSFTSLTDAVASLAKDIGKPENPHNRKRKNVLACSSIWDRNRNHALRNSSGGGISKRPTNSSRSTLSVAIAVSSSESNTSEDHEPRLPPLPPHGKSSLNTSVSQWSFSSRSFSLTDLQEAGARSSIVLRDEHKRFH